jgi:hypothetical protein
LDEQTSGGDKGDAVFSGPVHKKDDRFLRLRNDWLKETAEEQAALEHSANAVRVQCQKADQLVVSQAVTAQRSYGATRPDDGK